MDYDKLIEQLREYTYWLGQSGPESHDIHPDICDKAATAIETLQANLARMTAERDAAVSDIETALAYGVENCELCANSQCHLRGGTKPCLPKWRGIRNE